MQEAVVTPSIHAVSRDGARFMVILIGLIVIFKSKLTVLLNSIFSTITQRTGSL